MMLTKTEAGQRVLKDRSVALTPRQRTALILFDGKRSAADVLAATGAGGVTPEDIARLRELGLLAEYAPAPPAAVAKPAGRETAGTGTVPAADADRYLEAYRIATRLTSGLGLGGFRLNLAVEAAGSFDDLVVLAPRIRDAVGAEKFAPLEALIQCR